MTEISSFPRISTWNQVLAFLTLKKDLSEDTLLELWQSLDLDNLHLADLTFKIEGPNYKSTIRSDFAEGIIEAQKFFNRFILFLTEDENPYRQLTPKEKENLAFYLEIKEGSTLSKLLTTIAIMNAITSKIMKMPTKQIILLAFLAMAIWKSPDLVISCKGFYDTYKAEGLKLLIENRKFKANILDNYLKDPENDASLKVAKLLIESDQGLSDQEKILFGEFFKNEYELREKTTNAIIRNTADVSSISVNGYLYDTNTIKAIKESKDEDKIPEDVFLKEGYFFITSINRKDFPVLKIRVELADNSKIAYRATIDASEESYLSSEKISKIWDACEYDQKIYLKVAITKAKDGKLVSANVVFIE